MMNNELRPYEEMINSEIAWIGNIPTHWICVKLSSKFKERRTKVSDKEFKPLSVTKNGIVPQLATAAKSNDGDNRKLVKKGDFVINSRSDRKGSSGLSVHDGSVSLINIVLEPHQVNPRFAHYLFKSNSFVEEYYRNGRGIVADLWTTRFYEMRNIYLPMPTDFEQDQIIKYLDHQLAKINKFIKAKKKLIAVLKEQKQVVINEAVTKGLDSNVKMKPSGIEWIGEVPEHWGISRNKNIMKVKKVIVGDNHKEYKLLSLTVNGVIVRDISSGKGKFPSDFSTYQRVDNGDLVFCLFDVDETPRTVGCAYDTGMITGAYTVFEVKPEIRDYIYLYYLAIDNKKSLKPLYTGLRKVVPTDSLLRSKIAIPPLDEIRKIVNYINERTEAIDKSMKLIDNEISLLMEYKNSLITDVVTGKVDVRNIVIEELEDEIIKELELDEDLIDEEVLEAEDGDE